MPRYKLTLAYDGTAYQGWQKQPDGKSIQGTLESALYSLFGEDTTVVGSGRTDAGVHALGQVAHMDMALILPEATLQAALNSHLPNDIHIRQVTRVPSTFHARYNARRRTYFYLIRTTREPSPFAKNYTHHVPFPLDIARMQEAAGFLLGKHDFSAFRATGGGRTSPIRTIFQSEVLPLSGHLLCYLVSADAFLRKMVRGIVGTLIKIGARRANPLLMHRLLETKNRSMIGTLAPPQGLYLAAVSYGLSEQGNVPNG